MGIVGFSDLKSPEPKKFVKNAVCIFFLIYAKLVFYGRELVQVF